MKIEKKRIKLMKLAPKILYFRNSDLQKKISIYFIAEFIYLKTVLIQQEKE